MARTLEEAKKMIKILVCIAEKCGLNLNTRKSKVLIFNSLRQPEKIEEIQVVDKIKYLGVTVTNKKDCFGEHRKETIVSARKFANLSFSIMARSCNRVMIGKTYWKNLAMPSFLYASEILDFDEKELQKHQTIENQVYRTILQQPSYVAVSGLRSELGASSSRARDIKTKILFAKYIMEKGSDLLKKVFIHKYDNDEDQHIHLLKRYMEAVEVNLTTIQQNSIEQIKRKVDIWDSARWRQEVDQKTTLRLYGKYKTEIQEIKWFDNSEKSKTMMKARLGALELNWRQRHLGGDVTCPLCNTEIETEVHFLVECEKYSDLKSANDFLFENLEQGTMDDVMAEMLLLKNSTVEIEKKKELLQKMYNRRRMAQKRREADQH